MGPTAWFNLWLISSEVVPLHPLVDNPYAVFPTIPFGTSHSSVLDFTDAFFSICLDTQAQNIFAFT